jgi:phosphate transport system substrate-binding protein
MERRQPVIRGWPCSHMAIMVLLGALVGAEAATAEEVTVSTQQSLDPALEAYLPTVGLKGKLVLVGSDTMLQLLRRLDGEFSKWYPAVTVSVETEGSVAGFEQFLEWSSSAQHSERSMLLAYSHPLEPERIRAFTARMGYAPTEIDIALGAVTLYVHESNPLRELTLEQVDAIFGTTRKRGAPLDITRWGQLGLGGEWEQKPIHLYGRDKQSGTRLLFETEALLGGQFKANVQEEGGAGQLVLAISNDPLGIGYAGVLFRELSTVEIVGIAERAGKPFFKPSAETVRQGTYPMGRKLFLYANKAPGQDLAPVIREFLEFANSREGQAMVVQSGFYPLSLSEVTSNLLMLAARTKSRSR